MPELFTISNLIVLIAFLAALIVTIFAACWIWHIKTHDDAADGTFLTFWPWLRVSLKKIREAFNG